MKEKTKNILILFACANRAVKIHVYNKPWVYKSLGLSVLHHLRYNGYSGFSSVNAWRSKKYILYISSTDI